jgi:hypothetical protein
LSYARRNFQSSYCRYLFCQERRFDYILSLIFVSCEKELFSRHTVDIYFDKKGVLTIIQYTVGQVINSNWKSHVLCCNVYMCYIREEYNVYKNVVDLFQVYLRGTLKYYWLEYNIFILKYLALNNCHMNSPNSCENCSISYTLWNLNNLVRLLQNATYSVSNHVTDTVFYVNYSWFCVNSHLLYYLFDNVLSLSLSLCLWNYRFPWLYDVEFSESL